MSERSTSTITQLRCHPRRPCGGRSPRDSDETSPRDRVRDERGFTLIEILVAAVVLVVGALAVLGTMIAATKTTGRNKVRQTGLNLARELVEDARSLGYDQLVTASLPSELQPLVAGSTVNGSQLSVTRAGYTFNASVTECSLDDPSDGYGNHAAPPNSGGAWCPDVAAGGTTDSNPDDAKRVAVVVAPTGVLTTPTIQETVLVYARPTHGPAVSCLSTTTSCPGTNQTFTSGAAQTFNVTTTAIASAIQWLVNGNLPTSGQIPAGGNDPYVPGSTLSQFTWAFPAADGSYTIAATGFDQNGNSGTRSTLQITLNRHPVIAPTTLNAGWNAQINGVDVQWAPSIDQDVLYYRVYHNGAVVPGCSQVNGTSCSDLTAQAPTSPIPPCQSPPQSNPPSSVYWVVGVDTDPTTGQPRESTLKSPQVDANLCDHPPSAPLALTGSVSGGNFHLSWSAPASPADPDPGDTIQAWRIYRWPAAGTVQFPGSRLDLVGTVDSSGNPVSSYDDHSPDPGGVAQSYCVTSIDTHLNESPCSNAVSG